MRASAWTFLVAVVGVFLIGCNKTTSSSADSTLPGGGAFDADAARAQIITADSAWVRAVQSKNVDSWMTYYASDAVSMSEGAKAAEGTDAIRAATMAASAAPPMAPAASQSSSQAITSTSGSE
jgi:hypothetical protein